MSQMFFVQYEVRPLPQNEEFEVAGGAFANCFVHAETAERAHELVVESFAQNAWEVVAVEEPLTVAERSEYSGDWLDWYDEAVLDGECYVFHLWPNEPQDEDPLH